MTLQDPNSLLEEIVEELSHRLKVKGIRSSVEGHSDLSSTDEALQGAAVFVRILDALHQECDVNTDDAPVGVDDDRRCPGSEDEMDNGEAEADDDPGTKYNVANTSVKVPD